MSEQPLRYPYYAGPPRRNPLAAAVNWSLYVNAKRPPRAVRWQLKPDWLPWWAWNRRPVRWLLMRCRRE